MAPAKKMAFEIQPCTKVDRVLQEWLIVNAHTYRKESGDITPPMYNLDAVKNSWIKNDDSIMLWLLIADGKKVMGYAITEITEDSFSKLCLVAEAWISPKARRRGVPALAMAKFEEWAYAHGAQRISFGTWRSAPAYERLLGRLGYSKTVTYFEKKIERGE